MKTTIYQTKRCFGCGETSTITLNEAEYNAWMAGALVQDAFPSLTPEQRELLISGTHAICWDEMFGDEEDADGVV